MSLTPSKPSQCLFTINDNAISSAKEGTSCASFHSTVCEAPTLAAVLRQHCSFNAYYFEYTLSGVVPGKDVFSCKGTADKRNDKCCLRFRREGLTAAFRKFPRALEIWVFRLHSLASHLSYPPYCPQWNSARKTAFPATKPIGASQKGKELKPITFKTSDYACKKNDNRTRAEGRY